MQEDAYGLAGRGAGERLVQGLLPELYAQGADGGGGDDVGEADELEVEGAEGGVRVLDRGRDEAPQQVRVVVAGPFKGVSMCFFLLPLFGEWVFSCELVVLELLQAVVPRRGDVGVCYIAPARRANDP